jgi:multisubunit Na+/H+ antiporter MnhF subunit
MGQFNKTLLMPIVAFLALIIKWLTGYQMPDVEMDIVATGILGIITAIGLWMNRTKK